MSDPIMQLRRATKRAKSDVANKLISMFLHELSTKICRDWGVRVDSDSYVELVRSTFGDLCPYCLCDLHQTTAIIEHLDGMNRYRVGLHIPGNVLVSCRKCNSEKRRDDSKLKLTLADTGWASFLSHNGERCSTACATCDYWVSVWPSPEERTKRLAENLERISQFRRNFRQFESTVTPLLQELPTVLTKLYSDCQLFAESEIRAMLQKF